SKLESVLDSYIPEKEENSLLKAFLLGESNELSPYTKAAYSGSGTMHILAVSGLHVGIIVLFFGQILLFIKRRQFGKWIYLVLMISMVWVYALLTGFSPSIIRAAIMFSILIIGQTIGKF